MRRALLLLAAVPLLVAPPALAHDPAGGGSSSCRVPDITSDYDVEAFAVHVSLPASGCASREHRQFVLSASISRMDHDGGRQDVDRSVVCGPFRSAADVEPGDAAPEYSCDVDVALDHPAAEHADYEVTVSYPAPYGDATSVTGLSCTSTERDAACADTTNRANHREMELGHP